MTSQRATAGASVRVEASAESAALRRLEVQVPPARVDRAFERAYRDLARRVRVRGFRPGRAPRSVLERLYGGAVAEDLKRALVAETLPGVLESEGLRPVSEPSVDASVPSPGEPFCYTARVEVKPEIVLPDLQGLPARRPRVEVSDGDVEQQLEALREQQASWVEEPPDTPAARGHRVPVDFEGRVDGKPFAGGTGHDVPLVLGSGGALPGFEEQLEGVRSGDEREVRVRFPEDHPERSLAGKEAVFVVRATAVQRREVPALDDEFAKDLGDFATLAQLRERVRRDLEAAREREARATLRRSLLDALLERVSLEIPPRAIQRRLERRLGGAAEELGDRLPREALERQLQRWEEEWRPLAERELREEWVLEAVARQRELIVADAELEARLAEIAAERGTSSARLRKAYDETGLLHALRTRLLEEKALEFLIAEAKVEETSSA